MISFLVEKIHDPHFMTMLLAAVAVSATAYTLIMPLFAGEGLAKRMKAVASERERIRARERERLNKTEGASKSLSAGQKKKLAELDSLYNLRCCARSPSHVFGLFLALAGIPVRRATVIPASDDAGFSIPSWKCAAWSTWA